MLMHYLVVVVPAPHGSMFDAEQEAKPAVSYKYLLTKPRVKNLGIGSLDVDHGLPVTEFFLDLAAPFRTGFTQTVSVAIPEVFGAYCSRAPPHSFLRN